MVGVDAESVGGDSFTLKPARAERVARSDSRVLFLRQLACGQVS